MGSKPLRESNIIYIFFSFPFYIYIFFSFLLIFLEIKQQLNKQIYKLLIINYEIQYARFLDYKF